MFVLFRSICICWIVGWVVGMLSPVVWRREEGEKGGKQENPEMWLVGEPLTGTRTWSR
ncbi:hypothetical protein N431DRAFT_179633 [Stipitochalara longipes BDJ]|nr:hypothetical protein N431DRAFT_179633 [Stipitochalara longipes BDJ]